MLQLAVLDTRRGNTEGQEDDKVLAWFPAGLPPAHQSGLAGLLHGLLLFTSNFTHSQRPRIDSAETDSGTWVLLEAEPYIWFAALAPRAWLPRHATELGVRGVLAQAHLLTTVLCGSVQGMLEQDPEGSLARLSLQAVLHAAGSALGRPLSWLHRQLRNPLCDLALPPALPLGPAAALAAQSLANRALQAALGGQQQRPVQGLLLLYGPHLLWSSLLPRDTAALFALVATGLLHASPASGGSSSGGGAPGSGGNGGASGGGASGSGAPDLQPLDGGAWHQLPSGFLVQRAAGSAEGGGPGGITVPQVRLQQAPTCQQQQGQQQAEQATQQAGQHAAAQQGGSGSKLHRYHLLPLLEGRLLVALVLGGPSRLLTTQLLAGLQALLAEPAQGLAAQIAEDVRGSKAEAAHLPGFRYLFQDGAGQVSRASPRSKVSAMSHHARSLAATVRESVGPPPPPEWEAEPDVAGAEGPEAAALPVAAAGDQQVLEVLARSSQDVWAAAWRPGGGRQLLAVRERRTEREPGEAAEVMQSFAATNFLI